MPIKSETIRMQSSVPMSGPNAYTGVGNRLLYGEFEFQDGFKE
jgi:hypothetical protein